MASGGGLIQLVSKGIQDAYIIDSDAATDASFFRTAYRRHANFSHVARCLGGTLTKETTVIKIERYGDLVNHVWLEGTGADELDLSGTVFDLYIGGQKVDSHTFDYTTEIWPSYMADTYAKTATNTGHFIPLHFFFCDSAMFLPLVALQYADVEIHVAWGPATHPVSGIKCYANYVYLDTAEREAFVNTDMELLITQVQRYSSAPLSNGQVDIDLSYLNHPVKSIFFGFEKLEEYVPTDSFTFSRADMQINGTYLFEGLSAQYFHTVQCYYNTKFGVSKYDYLSGSPVNTRYSMYNFCIDASSYAPTGTCNFSRLDNAKLTLHDVAVAPERLGGTSTTIKLYAVNYNIMRIKKGIAGIIFAD